MIKLINISTVTCVEYQPEIMTFNFVWGSKVIIWKGEEYKIMNFDDSPLDEIVKELYKDLK